MTEIRSRIRALDAERGIRRWLEISISGGSAKLTVDDKDSFYIVLRDLYDLMGDREVVDVIAPQTFTLSSVSRYETELNAKEENGRRTYRVYPFGTIVMNRKENFWDRLARFIKRIK